MPWDYLYYMATVHLNRSPADFWRMTFRELDSLITEWSRMEEMLGQISATRTGYAVQSFKVTGKSPEWKSKPQDTVVDNDRAFSMM